MLGFLAFATSKLHLTKFHYRKRIEKLNQRRENECQLTSEFFPKKKKKLCIFPWNRCRIFYALWSCEKRSFRYNCTNHIKYASLTVIILIFHSRLRTNLDFKAKKKSVHHNSTLINIFQIDPLRFDWQILFKLFLLVQQRFVLAEKNFFMHHILNIYKKGGFCGKLS